MLDPSLQQLADQANAVAVAPNLPQAPPSVAPEAASGVPPLGVPVAAAPPADDSTIVVTPSPAPPPKVTVVRKPPGLPSAQPAAGGASPSADLQGLMADATAPADPNGDQVDQALAADATARAAPAPAKPGDMAASGAAVDAAGAAQRAALVEGAQVDKDNAAAEAAGRQQLADETAAKAAEQKKLRDESTAHIDQLRKKAAETPYHSFFETRTTGQMILAGLGQILGSASFAAGHVNQATGIIDRAIQQEFAAQQAQHAQLWKNVDTAMSEGQALRSDQLQEMSDFRARQAQTLDAIIAKGKDMAALSKNKQAVADLDAKNAQLAFERDKIYDEAQRLKHAQLETERHNKAEEGIGRAKVGVEGARLRMDKGNADELKVAKALDTSLSKDKVTTANLNARNSLQEARAAVATGNPVAIQGAIDSYIRSQTGLGARPGSIKLFTDRLGGAYEQLQAWISEKKTGALPPSMIKRFSAAVDDAYGDNTARLTKSMKLHEKALLSSPEYKRHADLVKAHLADRFGDIAGGAEPVSPPDTSMVTIRNAKTGETKQVTRAQAQALGAL